MTIDSSRAHGDAHVSGHADDGAVHAHVSSVSFYIGIFALLVVLTFATVKVSYYDFGSLNTVVALLIATTKASLVAAFFMHLRYDNLFNTLALLGAFLFLAIFILLTYDDVGQRGRIDADYGGYVLPQSGQVAPGGMPATTATSEEVGGAAPKEGPAKTKE